MIWSGTMFCALLLLLLPLLLMHCSEATELTLTYKYLDNVIYHVPLFSILQDSRVEFPSPPLIPPPPPSWNSDTNAILREAVFTSLNSQLAGSRFPSWRKTDNSATIGIEDCRQYFMDSQSGSNRSQETENNNNNNQVLKEVNGSKEFQRPGVDKWKTGPRGPRGLPGRDGVPGPPGPRGMDGFPGLVVFSSLPAMQRVQLEGLIAYRSDIKQLFLRDNVSWRIIRTSRCGDGIVDTDTGEQCDDFNNDPHDDCTTCRKAFCGDGIHNVNAEECDGRDFGGQSCATYRQGMTGSLVCLSNCIISHERCRRQTQRKANV